MFLQNIFLGFTIALPIGAISIEIAKQGMKGGFLSGWMVGIGALSVDVLLMVLMNVGLAEMLIEVEFLLWALGAFFLGQLAYYSFKEIGETIEVDNPQIKNSLKENFLKGLKVGVNPANIIFWISVLGVSVSSSYKASGSSIVLISVAILLGIVVHDIILAAVMSKFNKYINDKTNKIISVVTGLLLLGFSIKFAYNCATEVAMMF